MTRDHCLMRGLLMILAICAMCSTVPERLSLNAFCISSSIGLLESRKEKMALRRHNVNTFKGINSKVKGRTFERLSVVPFYE